MVVNFHRTGFAASVVAYLEGGEPFDGDIEMIEVIGGQPFSSAS